MCQLHYGDLPHGEEAPPGPRKARPDDRLRAVSNHGYGSQRSGRPYARTAANPGTVAKPALLA
jgi:hypothetical protein